MTEVQQPIMDFIHARHAAGNGAPSTTEVRMAFRYRNETGVLKALEALAAAGLLERKADRWELKTPAVQLSLELAPDNPAAQVKR